MGILRDQSIAMLSRRTIQLFLLGISILILIVTCSRKVDRTTTSPTQITGNCRVVQHEAGKTCIPQNPRRVVTLWMATFRSTLALGIQPIATTWSSDDPLPKHLKNQLNNAESIKILGWQPNLEKLLLLKPDLILSNTWIQGIHGRLSQIAPTVVLSTPSLPPPWHTHLEDVAQVLDKEPETKRLINRYWQRINQLKQALGDLRQQLKVSVITVTPPYGIITYGKKHPTGKLLDDIGLQRPPMQTGDFFTKEHISLELLPEVDGDVIFLSYRGRTGKDALEKLQRDPLWRTLKAMQQNRVYLVDSDHWYAFDVLAMNAVLDDLEKYLVDKP